MPLESLVPLIYQKRATNQISPHTQIHTDKKQTKKTNWRKFKISKIDQMLIEQNLLYQNQNFKKSNQNKKKKRFD